MDKDLKYGLPETDLKRIITLLQQNPKIKKITLFGSRAKGNFKEGSDIDIALIGNNLLLNDILDATIELEKLNLPFRFDLIIYDRIKEEALKEHIDRVGIILYTQH